MGGAVLGPKGRADLQRRDHAPETCGEDVHEPPRCFGSGKSRSRGGGVSASSSFFFFMPTMLQIEMKHRSAYFEELRRGRAVVERKRIGVRSCKISSGESFSCEQSPVQPLV